MVWYLSKVGDMQINFKCSFDSSIAFSCKGNNKICFFCSGLPEYVENLHKAALNINKHREVDKRSSNDHSRVCEFPNFTSREVETM